jgi:amino acid transporter
LLFPILAIFIASMLVSFFPPFGTLVLGCSSMILFPISTVVLVVVALVKEVQREDGPGQCTTGAAIAVIVSCAVLAIVLIALQLWWFTKTMPHV